MKPVQPDDKLALAVGEKPVPRPELTKKLWAYIRKNGWIRSHRLFRI
jgi:chromatin remodeling complex protein RSC6